MVLASGVAFGAGPKSDSKAYLVGFKDGHSPKGLAIAGLKVKNEWSELGAALVEADGVAAAKLKGHPGVAYVEEDRPVYAFASGQFVDNGEITWGLQAVKAQAAWSAGAKGQGIKLCVLDTGIDYGHPEFYRNGTSIIKGSANFVADGHPDATDGDGHGTHVAGTIAAQVDGSGVAGVAPDVELYIARVLGDDGSGSTSGVINALNWCQNTAKAQIASLSLGSSQGSKTEQKAYDTAYNKGMLIVAASGNDGARTISYPARYASAIAVGAVDANLALASFSNSGREQELVGPGVQVLSSVPRGTGLTASASEDGTAYQASPLEFAGTGTVSGPLVNCGLGDSATSCTGAPTSGPWIAMVDRGTNAFSDKVTNVMAQGAAAAIIANNDTAAPNDPGTFTLGAAGNWLPTVSISYNDGLAVKAGGLGSATVSIAASDYAYFNGTSMATPHVSAVAALAWSANPALTNVQIRTILQSTAQDLGAAGRDTSFGYGLVQADAAVAAARNTR